MPYTDSPEFLAATHKGRIDDILRMLTTGGYEFIEGEVLPDAEAILNIRKVYEKFPDVPERVDLKRGVLTAISAADPAAAIAVLTANTRLYEIAIEMHLPAIDAPGVLEAVNKFYSTSVKSANRLA